MMRFATLLTLLAAAEAQTKYKCDNKSKITCNDPLIGDLAACECVCPATDCEAYQTLSASCVCEDNPCDPCAIPEGAMATEADFEQGAQPDCACSAADGEDPCDAKYGGLFTTGADGTACPAGDAGETTEGGDDMMDESGAAQLLAGTMVLAASLLI